MRRALQESQEGLKVLSRRDGIHPRTVAKWKKRTPVTDAPLGPKQPHSTVLTPEQEALNGACRPHTLLPLDECLYALQATILHLTRSALHRCSKRHGITRVPDIDGDKPAQTKFKPSPIGYCHMDMAEMRTEEGKLCLFVALRPTCKFAYAERHAEAHQTIAAPCLRNLIATVPDKIPMVRTDNGLQFTHRQQDHYACRHLFDRVSPEQVLEPRLTQAKHPCTNGQVARMNRTVKEVTVQTYCDQPHQQLKHPLQAFRMS